MAPYFVRLERVGRRWSATVYVARSGKMVAWVRAIGPRWYARRAVLLACLFLLSVQADQTTASRGARPSVSCARRTRQRES